MICHRRKLIFVHLRRTAGNSIEAALGGIVLFDRWFRRTDTWDNRIHRGRSWYKRDRRGHPIHATAREIRSLYPHEFNRYFRFTIVRNPWEQMASLYGRICSSDVRFAGFRDWVRRFDLIEGTVPEASLFDSDGNCLVDFIGRFERLEQDFSLVCDRIGIPRFRLPAMNSSAIPRLDQVYDEESRRTVEKLYAADITRFGYTFDAARDCVGPLS
jgi:hypothetical protein